MKASMTIWLGDEDPTPRRDLKMKNPSSRRLRDEDLLAKKAWGGKTFVLGRP